MRGSIGITLVLLAAPFLSFAAPSAPCVRYWGEARYVIGYNHIVHLVNGCDRDAWCGVSSNLNPQVQHVTVPVGAHVQVVTFLGSPSRNFTPIVDCTLESPPVVAPACASTSCDERAALGEHRAASGQSVSRGPGARASGEAGTGN